MQKQGIKLIPPDKSLAGLFTSCAHLLEQMNRYDEAIDILEQGINCIPSDKSLSDLFNSYARLLSYTGHHEEAITALRQALNRIPINKGLASLYWSYGDLLAQQGLHSKAISVLKKGIKRIPADKSVFSLYIRCSELFIQTGQQNNAISLLEQGIERLPVEDVPALYHPHIKLLIASKQTEKAIETLLDGIKTMPVHQKALFIETLLQLYLIFQNKQGIEQFIKTTQGIQVQHSVLAKILLYQIQGRWNDAAEYGFENRLDNISSLSLATAEAFSWLCAEHPKRALDAISIILKNKQRHGHWLHAFIQLQLGSIEKANEAILAYNKQEVSAKDISKAQLLDLWDQPSDIVEQDDLAYYFPTLPPILTGLKYSVTRIPYHPSVLPDIIKTRYPLYASSTSEESDNDKNGTSTKATIMLDEQTEAHEHTITCSANEQIDDSISNFKFLEKGTSDNEPIKSTPDNQVKNLNSSTAEHINNSEFSNEETTNNDQSKPFSMTLLLKHIKGFIQTARGNPTMSKDIQQEENVNEPTKILFLSANPSDQARIQTDKEHRIIKAEMERGRHRDFFEFLPSQFAVTITELLRAMNDKPHIVHFSGHGETKGILISTDSNVAQIVPIRALKRLFTPLKGITKIVLLNSCYSAEQAEIISEYGMFVIGMNLPVGDQAAISFAKGLYNGLGEGKTIEAAYNDAMIVLETENPDYADVVEVWKNGEKLSL